MIEGFKFTHVKPPQNIQELKTTESEEGRFYLAPGKKSYPSVTTVCGCEKNQHFAKWRAENPVEATRTTVRGNAIHEACENYLNNEPDWGTPAERSHVVSQYETWCGSHRQCACLGSPAVESQSSTRGTG